MTLARRLSLFFTALAVVTAAVIGALAYAATDHSLDAEIRVTLADAAATLLAGQVPEGLSPQVRDDDHVGVPGATPDDDSPGSSGQPRADRSGEPSENVTETGNEIAAGTRKANPTESHPEITTENAAGRLGNEGAAGHLAPPRRSTLVLAQSLDTEGRTSGVDGRPVKLPVGATDLQIAREPTDNANAFRVVEVDGARYLMLTRSRGGGRGAVQVARSLSERDEVLTRLAGSIVVIALAVAVAAAVAGIFLARRLTRRLVRLTAAAEEVIATGRLDVEVPAGGADEVGRLGTTFDTMLGRLARSREDQQRLVQDAGHELRTPLTSIRTNISLLRREAELPPGERAAVLDDLAGESRELTGLVDELVELATDQHAGEGDVDIDLADVAEHVAARARRRSGRRVTVEIAPDARTAVRGRASGLERAVSNLVDNALKFAADAGEPVEIGVASSPDGGTRVAVSDRGPGIPLEDLGLIFSRFHRAASVRSLPGSGLGLSIVQDVAATHGGGVFAANRPGGGAVIGFTLPPARLQPASNPG